MKLDLVHDIQSAYRQTLDSMSRPGLINNISTQADKVTMEISCYNSTLVLVLMLIDTEVKFKVCSEREAEVAKLINQLTYAKATEVESADYILVLNDVKEDDLETAFRMAYSGDLLDPHKAATIIIEVDAVSNDRNLTLTGPGIEKECYINVKAIDRWVDLRAEKNSEYPLGIDLIFTDRANNILCLPRTTQIAKQVVG
ncbi:MAG: phosphonate C-P lyase system protein PhnH [Desulfosporosinus sp.]|nr:phosphonate C-P lyase system protein PhnH [Desulfosporosinus sp.]